MVTLFERLLGVGFVGFMVLSLGVFQVMFLWIGKNCGQSFISQVLGVPNYGSIPQNMVSICFVPKL